MVPSESTWTDSFETVMSQQGERLVKSLTSVFLDRELAADAAQEAFVQLYIHWDEVTQKGDPEPWLYKVALNRCNDYRRGMARATRLFHRLVETLEDEAGDDRAPQSEFMSIVGGLPVRQRAAAALYYGADLSIAEIAAVMGISEGSVNTHLHRARIALQRLLKAQ